MTEREAVARFLSLGCRRLSRSRWFVWDSILESMQADIERAERAYREQVEREAREAAKTTPDDL